MRFRNFQNLQEKYTRLTPKEFTKNASAGDYKGEHRIDVLIRLIQDDKPVELAKSGSVRIKATSELIQKLKAWKEANLIRMTDKSPIEFQSKDGKNYTTSDIGKSVVFGGGPGSSAGTSATKVNESHQCCMCQAMIEHGIQDLDFFTTEIIEDAYSKVKVDANLKEVLTASEKWVQSSYNSAKILLSEGYINKSQRFHSGDRVMKNIYALKDAAFANTDMPKLKDDKWNPGDIWAIEKGFNLRNLDVSSIGAYNDNLLSLFFDRKIVAISLKGAFKYPPYIGDYNIDKGVHPLKVKYEASYLSSRSKTFWSSKGSSIVYTGGRLILKDNSPGGSTKAEIEGKDAFGGGISWGGKRDTGIIDYIKEHLGVNLPKHAGGITDEAKSIAEGDEKVIKKFYKMFNHFEPSTSYQEMVKELERKDWKWISAKLGSLYICYSLDTKGGSKVDDCINDIVNYAGSTKKESGPYVKVGM